MEERYKLILGDCLEKMKELSDASIDCIITDPPYGHNNNDGDLIANRESALGRKTDATNLITGQKAEKTYASRPILNDGKTENEQLIRSFFREASRVLVKGGCCCCCGGGGPDPQFARWSLWLDEVIPFKMAVVWDKGGLGMGWHYRRNYEFVLVAQKEGAACKWYDTTNKIANVIKMNKIIPSKEQHPTEKPVKLMEHFIRLHTKEGDTILDPFMGSGTTGVAALKLNRKFIGIELDEQYFKMAEKRIKAQSEQQRLDRFYESNQDSN